MHHNMRVSPLGLLQFNNVSVRSGTLPVKHCRDFSFAFPGPECCWPLYLFIYLFILFLAVFPGPGLTHTNLAHIPTLISIAPTLVAYLLSSTDTGTLITSYPTDLATVLTSYPTNLVTLLNTYLINLTIRFRVETHKLINNLFTNV